MTGHILGTTGYPAPGQVTPGGHQVYGVAAEAPLHQIGVGQRCKMIAQGDIEPLLHDIDEAVGDIQLDPQLRIL